MESTAIGRRQVQPWRCCRCSSGTTRPSLRRSSTRESASRCAHLEPSTCPEMNYRPMTKAFMETAEFPENSVTRS